MDTTIPLAPAPAFAPSGNDKLWAVVCHLSDFIGAPLLIPLIVYLVMKDDSPFVRRHASEALNFHLSLLLYSVVCIPLVFVLVGVFFLIALGVIALICAIVAAIKAGDGRSYAYPMTIRFVS